MCTVSQLYSISSSVFTTEIDRNKTPKIAFTTGIGNDRIIITKTMTEIGETCGS